MASDIVITPNRGSTSVNAKIDFTGASTASSQIRLEVLPDNSLAFVGTTGSLFSIADSVTGSLMSVNDASGLPILEVFDTDKVVMGQYNQNTLVVNGTQVGIGTGSPTNKLTIAGVNSNGITLTGSNATITSAGTTPNLILSAGTNIYARPGSGYDLIVDSGNGINVTTGNIRAPSFIDSADSTYSLDLNSTADTALRIRGGAVFGPNSTWSRYLMVGGNGRSNYTDNTQYASVTTTNGNLHLDAASGFNSYINWYDGTDLIVGAGDSSTERFRVYGSSNYTFASGEIRSPVFKDSADTAYYVDPNATSVLSKLSIGNAPYVSSIQAGALELGRTDTNYQYTSGWTGSMQGGILANCSDNWEFVIHDSGHRLASAFEFRGAGTNVMRLGRDLGWGVTPIEIPGNLTVVGNLTVNGTTTTVNSTTVTIDDPIFTLGGDTAPASDDNKDRGIEFRWHNGTAAKAGFFGFDDSTGYFTFIPDSTNTSEVFSGTQGDIQASNFRGNVVGGTVTVAGTLTINKSGTNSDIIFPAQANDPGYIRHYESNNTAIMYFNVSDDTNDEFHFGYTGDPSTFRLRSDGTVLEGIWQGSSITTTYTDAKVATLTGQSGRILIQGGVSASAQTLGLSIPVAFDQTLKNNARNITGGGTISVSASGEVKWSARFIIISGGRGANYATSGYWDIDCPTSGTITGVGGAANQTANANGIPMGGWQALYYILPIGSGNGSLAANFRLVHYSSDLDIPIDWVLICVRNSDTDTFYFPNGVVLGLGGASARGLQTSANTANAVVIRDGSGNFSAGTVTATQFNGSGAGLSSGTVPIASLVAGDYSSKITSGTYSINVTSADQIDGVAFRNTGSNAGTAADSLEQNGITYVNSNISLLGQSDGALFSQAYNSNWQHQIYGDYRTGQIVVRGKNNGTWQSWRTVLDSSNYTSYTGHIGNGTLTLNTSGNGISGSTSFTANQSGAGTFTVTSNATAANTASTIVFRDGSGNFAAGQITGTSFLKNSITVPGMFVQAGSTGAPSAIQNGDLWWNTETGKLKIWYSTSSAWVDATSVPDLANYFPVAGGNITGNVSIGGLLNTTGNITARNGQTHSLSMGHHPSYGTSWGAVWRTGSDYALLTNSSDTLINAPSGSVGFRVANSQYAHVATDGVHTSYWFRNDANNAGLYNTNTTQHLSSNTNGYWDMSSTTTVSAIRLYTGGHLSALRGYVYANNSNDIGFLESGGGWRLRIVGGDYLQGDGSSIRGQLFYDSNDTTYWLDPAADTASAGLSGRMKSSFTINHQGSSSGYGLALYPAYNTAGNLEPTYGMMFASSSTFGAHGAVATGDWATYFTMSNTDSRGWIFRKVGSGNVASISGSGRMRVQSLGVNSDPSATAGTIVTSGAITAGSFVKSGGAANELLKADGFVELETNYVKINNTQTISGLKTFSSQVNLSDSLFFDNFGITTGIYFRSASTNRLVIWYSNNTAVIGAGTGVDVTIGATNPIRIKSATGAIECASSVTATSFIKSSGTSSQFLKADGSVDSSTYLTTAVTSLTGTANQVTVSASTGSVTLSLPQSINTGANIQFGSLGIGTGASGTTGEIRATNNITAYYSDDRLKTKLGAIENPIEKVKALSGFYFEANETAVALGYQKKREVGVSAQEVQVILPEIIAPAPIDDKYMTVRYEKLIPLLIEAIKAQQVQIEELQKLIKEKA